MLENSRIFQPARSAKVLVIARTQKGQDLVDAAKVRGIQDETRTFFLKGRELYVAKKLRNLCNLAMFGSYKFDLKLKCLKYCNFIDTKNLAIFKRNHLSTKSRCWVLKTNEFLKNGRT